MAQNALRVTLTALALLCALVGCSGHEPPGVLITALGNEGFLIESEDMSVVVDGFFDGLGGYVAPTEEQRLARERAEPPFDEVGLVLATHHHPDHFDARVVHEFLNANRNAVFVSTPMAVGQLRDDGEWFSSVSERVRAVLPAEGTSEQVEFGAVKIEVFNLHHGRNRSLPVENLGFVVEMNGVRFLHVGDTLATAEELAALGFSARRIDVAFVPYWHLLNVESARNYLEAIGATTIVAMHLPARDAPPSYLDPASDLAGLVLMVEEAAPGVLVPTEVMDVTRISVSD